MGMNRHGLRPRDDGIRVPSEKEKDDFDGDFDFYKVKYLQNNACSWKGAERRGNPCVISKGCKRWIASSRQVGTRDDEGVLVGFDFISMCFFVIVSRKAARQSIWIQQDEQRGSALSFPSLFPSSIQIEIGTKDHQAGRIAPRRTENENRESVG